MRYLCSKALRPNYSVYVRVCVIVCVYACVSGREKAREISIKVAFHIPCLPQKESSIRTSMPRCQIPSGLKSVGPTLALRLVGLPGTSVSECAVVSESACSNIRGGFATGQCALSGVLPLSVFLLVITALPQGLRRK